MGVLLIRAGDHPLEAPRTMVVLESEVAAYLAQGRVRVGVDPGRAPVDSTPAPRRPRFNGLEFQSGSTGE